MVTYLFQRHRELDFVQVRENTKQIQYSWQADVRKKIERLCPGKLRGVGKESSRAARGRVDIGGSVGRLEGRLQCNNPKWTTSCENYRDGVDGCRVKYPDKLKTIVRVRHESSWRDFSRAGATGDGCPRSKPRTKM